MQIETLMSKKVVNICKMGKKEIMTSKISGAIK